ncbi:hypothetical protein SARC_00677 [Sphaeroforma arctica JP610]|uniref:Myb-like domain-containing protein n=1 Tax=Sphaeroforma arctica JP610 TaxID=667725 RepID=A0A0L0GDW3_9EUKA|nr:hypothetical protein SARC_00677 [Sphaeroforma arctica JP610]KNC87200.1 hypothetical protein SARC_00677 [Sphaeroforma arctica JP610]|eukprot:XP_014161102.1 hypothetical protein SARC_00677 [Sphaeroforma arctica JP610]
MADNNGLGGHNKRRLGGSGIPPPQGRHKRFKDDSESGDEEPPQVIYNIDPNAHLHAQPHEHMPNGGYEQVHAGVHTQISSGVHTRLEDSDTEQMDQSHLSVFESMREPGLGVEGGGCGVEGEITLNAHTPSQAPFIPQVIQSAPQAHLHAQTHVHSNMHTHAHAHTHSPVRDHTEIDNEGTVHEDTGESSGLFLAETMTPPPQEENASALLQDGGGTDVTLNDADQLNGGPLNGPDGVLDPNQHQQHQHMQQQQQAQQQQHQQQQPQHQQQQQQQQQQHMQPTEHGGYTQNTATSAHFTQNTVTNSDGTPGNGLALNAPYVDVHGSQQTVGEGLGGAYTQHDGSVHAGDMSKVATGGKEHEDEAATRAHAHTHTHTHAHAHTHPHTHAHAHAQMLAQVVHAQAQVHSLALAQAQAQAEAQAQLQQPPPQQQQQQQYTPQYTPDQTQVPNQAQVQAPGQPDLQTDTQQPPLAVVHTHQNTHRRAGGVKHLSADKRRYIQRKDTHPSLLSWQWTAERRAKLAMEGVHYKLGYFTTFEDEIIRDNVTRFAEENGDTPESLVWTKGRSRKDFWREVCRGLERPLRFVAKHTRVLFPQTHIKTGYFSKEEDDQLIHLQNLKLDLTTIACRLGRSTDSVRHRTEYLTELGHRDLVNTGGDAAQAPGADSIVSLATITHPGGAATSTSETTLTHPTQDPTTLVQSTMDQLTTNANQPMADITDPTTAQAAVGLDTDFAAAQYTGKEMNKQLSAYAASVPTPSHATVSQHGQLLNALTHPDAPKHSEGPELLHTASHADVTLADNATTAHSAPANAHAQSLAEGTDVLAQMATTTNTHTNTNADPNTSTNANAGTTPSSDPNANANGLALMKPGSTAVAVSLPKRTPKRIIVARRLWTDAEDIRLMEAVMKVTGSEKQSDIVNSLISWKKVKNLMENRTSKQCQNRWPILAFATAQRNAEGRITNRRTVAGGNSTESRIEISKQICAILTRDGYVDETEVNWSKVGIEMGRHGKFIRSRYRFLRDLVPSHEDKDLPAIVAHILSTTVPAMEAKNKSASPFLVPAEMQEQAILPAPEAMVDPSTIPAPPSDHLGAGNGQLTADFSSTVTLPNNQSESSGVLQAPGVNVSMNGPQFQSGEQQQQQQQQQHQTLEAQTYTQPQTEAPIQPQLQPQQQQQATTYASPSRAMLAPDESVPSVENIKPLVAQALARATIDEDEETEPDLE